MTKTCGNCKWYEPEDDDTGVLYWGHCTAPIPMVVEDVGNMEVDENDKANACPTFKNKK
jgi:hypothetical protein